VPLRSKHFCKDNIRVSGEKNERKNKSLQTGYKKNKKKPSMVLSYATH